MNNSFNNLNHSRVFSKAGNVRKKIIIIVWVKIINYKKVNF